MDIDNFYAKYGEKELIKMEREQRINTDSTPTGDIAEFKKPAIPKRSPKKGTKGKKKKAAQRYQEEEFEAGFDEIDLTMDNEPGEYEINLSDNGEEMSEYGSERYSMDRSSTNMDLSNVPMQQSFINKSRDSL